MASFVKGLASASSRLFKRLQFAAPFALKRGVHRILERFDLVDPVKVEEKEEDIKKEEDCSCEPDWMKALDPDWRRMKCEQIESKRQRHRVDLDLIKKAMEEPCCKNRCLCMPVHAAGVFHPPLVLQLDEHQGSGPVDAGPGL